MATYSVVHFYGDDSVEPVPSFWFTKNGTCAWPKNRALIKKFVQLKTIPNEIEFDYHEARILKKNIKSFGEANNLAEKGCNQSDLSDIGELKSKRKLKVKTNNQSYSDCPEYSDSDDEKFNKSNKSDRTLKYAGWSPSPKKLKMLKNQQRPSIVKQLSYDIPSNLTDKYKNDVPTFNLNYYDKINSNEEIIEIQLESSDVHLDERSSEVCIRTPKLLDISTEAVKNSTPLGTDYQKETLHMLTFIKHELRRIINNQRDMAQRLDFIEIRLNSMPTKDSSMNGISSSLLNDMTCPLPIDNMADLDTLENNILGEGTFRINLVNELSYIGGKNVKSMVKRLMAKLFKDELLKDFSYTGKKGKQKFSNLATCSVIFDAIKTQEKFKHSTQNEMEDIIKYVLAQAPFNLKRQIEKKN